MPKRHPIWRSWSTDTRDGNQSNLGMNPALMNLMSKMAALFSFHSTESCNSKYFPKSYLIVLKFCHCSEADGQASGGDDTGNDDWIFNTIREKDLKKYQNGTAQPDVLERKQVRRPVDTDKFHFSVRSQVSLEDFPCFPGWGETKEAFVTKRIYNLFSVVYWGNEIIKLPEIDAEQT